jgi:hypothetical protein
VFPILNFFAYKTTKNQYLVKIKAPTLRYNLLEFMNNYFICCFIIFILHVSKKNSNQLMKSEKLRKLPKILNP